MENLEEPVKILTFERELECLINSHSKENESDTPDWILANYLKDCLAAFNSATKTRTFWYSAKPDNDIGIIK